MVQVNRVCLKILFINRPQFLVDSNDNWYLHFEHVEIKPEKKALPKKPKTIKEDDKTEASNGVSNKTTDGPKKTKRTLTAEEKAEIVMLLEQKVKSPVIAKQFKISLRTVQRIAKEARA